MFFVFSFLSLFLLSDLALASYISLRTTVNALVKGRILEVVITAVNKGDEPAYGVQAEVRAGNRVIMTGKKAELRVDEAYTARASFGLDLKNAGQYPLITILHYADANQYPFSALNGQTFVYLSEMPPQVAGKLSSAKFSKTGALSLYLKNQGEAAVKIKAKLALPRELATEKDQLEMELNPHESKTDNFTVENFSALAGSTYQVFAAVEYDAQHRHYTLIIPAKISVVEKNLFKDFQYGFYILIAALLLLFVYFQFKK
jgi:hypothetical protein